MSEMIERLARVLSPQSWAALNTPCDTKAKKKRREVSLEYAARCIEAMIEPTQEMKNAALNAAMNDENIYKAMIAEALR